MNGLHQHKAQLLPVEEFSAKLKSDYVSILRDELRNHGYESDHIREDDELIIAYFTLFSRRVESRPRIVHLATDITVDESVREGFELLIRKFTNGEDVNPHLSTLTAKLNKADKMFFDWGINHFHLGTTLMDNGFINRTGPIAYAVVEEDDIYILAVDGHGNWSNKDLISVIDSEWPELIQHARVEGTFECNFDTEDINGLRKANVNAGITLDNGHSYISVGGGYMSDGSWAKAVRGLIELNRLFIKIHRYYSSSLLIDGDFIARYGNQVDFRLKREDDRIYIVSPDFLLGKDIMILSPFPV